MPRKPARDRPIILRVFQKHYSKGATSFDFHRDELGEAAEELGIDLHDNVGAVIYDYRFRKKFPPEILATAPAGAEWRISLAGRSKYRFVLGPPPILEPREDLIVIHIPDATPEVVNQYRLDDEQAVLAKVRYNRLIDIFLGVTAYSLQNHLRTAVQDIGQIEIDELYVGLDRNGCHYVVPVQAKGGTDKLSKVQSEQDIAYCKYNFPELVCRPVSVQFMGQDVIAMFEMTQQADDIRVVNEQHYKLVPADQISLDDLRLYRERSQASR